ncbi:MAG TPA: alkaline phosphatase family protein, partial [Mycobacterium sp.]|nr:alkaline phosphatase family protein [Mycobacterium sp.]
ALHRSSVTWRQYAEDMGNDPVRDHGVADPSGGTDCAHPPVGAPDVTNAATPADQFADRHVPFLFFHSLIDDPARCNAHVVPLGTVTVGSSGAPDRFQGHLARDLAHARTTPDFALITPNLCNDGHDATCAGTNTEGGNTGGLVGADLWLRHWMPLILDSPAYRDGHTLVVVTFDESDPFHDATACCNEQPGPSWAWPGYATILGAFGLPAPTQPGQYPGGGRVGAVLLNARYIKAGSSNPTPYNHYSALHSYEDLLGIRTGGADGRGHLGFAAQPGLRPFGRDVFGRR